MKPKKDAALSVPKGWTFGPIPSEVLESDLSEHAKITVGAILYHAWDGGPCWPGTDRLARLTSTHVRTVLRAIKELETHEPPFLLVERRPGQTSQYRFLSHGTHDTQSRVTTTTPAPQSPPPVPHSHQGGDPQSHELDTLTRSNKREAAAAPAGPLPTNPTLNPTAFTAWYCEQYQQKFGVKYAHGGAKDMLAVKRLLATYGEGKARDLVTFAMSCGDQFYRRVSSSLCGLVSQAARIAALQAETTPAKRKAGEVPLNPPRIWQHEGKVYRLKGWPRYEADNGAVLPEDLVQRFS